MDVQKFKYFVSGSLDILKLEVINEHFMPRSGFIVVFLALGIVIDEQVFVKVETEFGQNGSELITNPGGHVVVVFVLGEEDATSVLKDWVLSAPEHHEIVVMRFADDGPWLCLVEPRVLVDVVTWLGHGDSRNRPDGSFGPVVGVDPSNIILPYILDVVMDVPVVLTRETVVMGIDSLCDPPFALNISNAGQVLLSIVLSDSALHVVWLLWLAAILEDTLGHFRESRKVSVLSDFAVEVTAELTFSATQDAGQ